MYIFPSKSFTNLDAVLWTHSNSVIPLYCGSQNCTQDPRWGCTSTEQKGTITPWWAGDIVLGVPQGMVDPLLQGHCWLIFNLSAAQTPYQDYQSRLILKAYLNCLAALLIAGLFAIVVLSQTYYLNELFFKLMDSVLCQTALLRCNVWYGEFLKPYRYLGITQGCSTAFSLCFPHTSVTN